MPRADSIRIANVAGQSVYQFTDMGLVELAKLATVGCTQSEIANYFGVSEDWVRKQMLTEISVIETHKMAEADGNLALRQAAHTAAIEGDSRVMTFLLERRLKMNKQVEHKHEHRVAVIGTMPRTTLESQDWFEQFAPKDVTAQIAHDAQKAKDEADDAEVI